MVSVYCGFEEFALDVTGDAMAELVTAVVRRSDPALGSRLQFDPEGSGFGVLAPSLDDLRRTLALAASAGLIAPGFVAELDDDDFDQSDDESDAVHALEDGHGHSVFEDGIPMLAYGVTDGGVIGRFSAVSFAGPAPADTAEDLARFAVGVLAGCEWAASVGIAAGRGTEVLVECPDIDVLERVAACLGISLSETAAGMFDVLRAKRDSPEPPIEDWLVRQRPDGYRQWYAVGPSRDVVEVSRDAEDDIAVAVALSSRLDRAGERGPRVEIHPDRGILTLAASDRADLEWALTELGIGERRI